MQVFPFSVWERVGVRERRLVARGRAEMSGRVRTHLNLVAKNLLEGRENCAAGI
jgi:hypothetical protein